MAKWFGIIGYAETIETAPGVWKEQIILREYYGDSIRNIRRIRTADKVNDDLSISNELSIVADPYAINNFYSMRYAEFMGAKWKISNVEVSYPRLILTLGGVWNGEQA